MCTTLSFCNVIYDVRNSDVFVEHGRVKLLPVVLPEEPTTHEYCISRVTDQPKATSPSSRSHSARLLYRQ